jgi:hypothetical protein
MVCPLFCIAQTDQFNVRVKCDVPVTVTDFVTRFCVAKQDAGQRPFFRQRIDINVQGR